MFVTITLALALSCVWAPVACLLLTFIFMTDTRSDLRRKELAPYNLSIFSVLRNDPSITNYTTTLVVCFFKPLRGFFNLSVYLAPQV